MPRLSVVIPALNEYDNMERVLAAVPHDRLAAAGWTTEVVVVDNGSTDGTGDLARGLGARVVEQPVRGYGNAYKAGFSAATGDVVATADADLTYPLEDLPELLAELERSGAEFMSTNRLLRSNLGAMKPSHMLANHALSALSRVLFRSRFRDSQSGMWVFRRSVWDVLDVRSGGMGFSQELKHAAFAAGLRCHEAPIEYRPRGGQVKLNAVKDGLRNTRELFEHRRRVRAAGPRPFASAAAPSRTALDGTAPNGSTVHESAVRAASARTRIPGPAGEIVLPRDLSEQPRSA